MNEAGLVTTQLKQKDPFRKAETKVITDEE